MPKTKAAAIPLRGIFDRVLAVYRSEAKGKVIAYSEMKDEQLIKLVQEGEDQAYKEVLKRYESKIFSYIMRLINHREEAADITQDVFLKAYKNLHRFDVERKFSSWIYRIAHNESVNWLKKKTRIKMESLDKKVEDGLQFANNMNTENDFIRREEQKEVRKAIKKLPQKYQDVMELRYLRQNSYEEISKKLNKPVNTVGTLINRAKKQLLHELIL